MRETVYGVLATFGVIWALSLIMAFPTLIIANGMFAVPISEVVNVKLSIVLFLVYVGLSLTGVLLILNLVTLNLWPAVVTLVLMAFLVVLPFGPIAACHFYAMMGNPPLTINSTVENGFLDRLSATIGYVTGLLGQAKPPSRDALFQVLSILTFVLGLPAMIAAWRQFLNSRLPA